MARESSSARPAAAEDAASAPENSTTPAVLDPPLMDELVGAQLGNYVIERALARGGMGIVYVARHLSLDRQVAVKVLNDDVGDSRELASRFREEARITASLRHPNIVELFDFGVIGGHYYYVMELLQGQDLATYLLGKGHLPVRLVVRCVQQICSALSAVHGAGVVHRDLKPGNVFVVSERPWRIKLVDFGIAKVVSGGKCHTSYGQIVGSPSHMAPEQALGHMDRISPRSDLYALGAIAYEMLTGQPLFDHDSEIMLLMMHIREPFIPIRDLAPQVPQPVAAVIEACLAKDPAQRPPSARAVSEELTKAAGEGAICLHTGCIGPGNSLVPPVSEPVLVQAPIGGGPGAPCESSLRPVPPEPQELEVVPVEALGSAGRQGLLPSSKLATHEPPPESGPCTGQDAQQIAHNETDPSELSAAENDTVARLLTRMQLKTDFPTFVRDAGGLGNRANAEAPCSAHQLGDAILKDHALTAKLLRTVNRSYANRFNGKVLSVKHAIVLLGLDRARTLALSISLFKRPPSRSRSKRAVDSVISSIVSGEIARALAERAGVKDAEQARLCGMFRNLGHHLLLAYLPEEYDRLLEARETGGLSLDQAARRVLGVSLTNLGIGVAERWLLPPRVVSAMSMRRTTGKSLETEEERLGALAGFSAALCEIVVSQSPGTWEQSLDQLLKNHRHLVRLEVREVPELLRVVRESIGVGYSSLELESDHTRFSQNVDTLPPVATGREPGAGRSGWEPLLAVPSAKGTQGIPAGGGRGDRSLVVPAHTAKGMADVIIREAHEVARCPTSSAPMSREEFDLSVQDLTSRLRACSARSRILATSLELLCRYLGLPRVLALIANSQRTELIVRAVVGEDAEALRTELTFPLHTGRARRDLFSSAYYGPKDVIIEDAFAPSARHLIPVRYFEAIGSVAFLLLSCTLGNQARVLLLADCDRPPLPAPALLANLGQYRSLVVSAAR